MAPAEGFMMHINTLNLLRSSVKILIIILTIITQIINYFGFI